MTKQKTNTKTNKQKNHQNLVKILKFCYFTSFLRLFNAFGSFKSVFFLWELNWIRWRITSKGFSRANGCFLETSNLIVLKIFAVKRKNLIFYLMKDCLLFYRYFLSFFYFCFWKSIWIIYPGFHLCSGKGLSFLRNFPYP